ncbi:MAG: amidohydrolase family protein [Polyangiaceae bacterium]|nr:amidohydrolase family protein [Polyangiaceae bacterium]
MRRGPLALALALLAALGAVLVLASRPPADDPPGGAPPPATAPTAGGGLPPAGRPLRRVDVHVHLSSDAFPRLARLMDRYEIDHVVNLSGAHPLRGLRQQLEVARRSGGRVTVFTGLAYEQAARPGYGKRMAELLELAHRMGARGLKISKALGLGLTGPDGRLVPVDDPELDPVFEKAGELGMPVAIHSGDPRAFWEPVTPRNERYAELRAHPGWALAGEPVPTFDEILAQLERRIARHPRTSFLSVHFGNCAEDPARVARWLRRYPNLYVDTAARVPELGRHRAEELRALFVEHQDRILYGSDLGVGPDGTPLMLGSEGPEPPTPDDERRFFDATRRFFETGDRGFDHPTPIQGQWQIDGIDLPPEVLRKLYVDNARRVLRLDLE